MSNNEQLYSVAEREFALTAEGQPIKIQHLLTPAVGLREDIALPTPDEESAAMLDAYFQALKDSDLNIGGNGVVFGTYDNLHLGHRNMLRTGAAISDNLYVGLEAREAALKRKRNSHPILCNDERREMLVASGVTNKVFVRTEAVKDIVRLLNEGVAISTLIVGETQSHNPELVEAVRFCAAQGIRVMALTRTHPLKPGREISSTALHRSGLAKVSP